MMQMMCHKPKTRQQQRCKSEERLYFEERQRRRRELKLDFFQISLFVMLELMSPKEKLVRALEKIKASVKEAAQKQQELLQEGQVLAQAQLKEQEKIMKKSQDIFIYGSDSNRIVYLLETALKEAMDNEIPRITLEGTQMEKSITFCGLRSILNQKFSKLSQPKFVLIILENFCENLLEIFKLSQFRESLNSSGTKTAVVAWSCIHRGQQIDTTLLAPFTTKLFVPAFNGEKPWLSQIQPTWLDEDESDCCKSDVSYLARNSDEVDKDQVAETSLTAVPGNFATTDDFYPEGTTKPGPSKAVIVDQPDDLQSIEVSKPGKVPTQDSSPQYDSISLANNVVQDPKSVVEQPVKLQPEVQTKANSKAIENVPDKQWDEKYTERRGFCASFADFCVAALECCF